MISTILPHLRCPRCTSRDLRTESTGVSCANCGSAYPVRMGVLDMLCDESGEIITPFQRLMQSRLLVSIYERIWRRIGYWLASSRSFSSEMETVRRLTDIRDVHRTLDLACGPGVFTRPLARQTDGLVVGLDLSRPMLAHALRTVQKEGIKNILLIRASAFSLPFADHEFQHINCCGALHLFDHPEAALKEMARVLDPKGFLSVQTTIRPARSAGLAYFLERFIRFGFFDEPELRRLLANHGFQIVKSERHRISFTFLANHDPS